MKIIDNVIDYLFANEPAPQQTGCEYFADNYNAHPVWLLQLSLLILIPSIEPITSYLHNNELR